MKISPYLQQAVQWTNRSIQRKLIIWAIGFWVVSLVILSLAIFWIGQTVITNEARVRNVQLASVVSRDVNSQISSIFSDIRIFSRYLESSGPNLDGQAADILALRLSSPQRYRAIYYFNTQGKLLLNLSDPMESLLAIKNPAEIVARTSIIVDKGIMDSYQMTRNINTYVSEVSFRGLDSIPVIYIGVPLNFTGSETRVAVFEIDLRDIWQRIDLSTIGQSGITYAVSRTGSIIAYPDPAYIGKPSSGAISPLLQGFEGYTEYENTATGKDVIAAYSPVGGQTGWGIVVVQDKSEANAQIIRAEFFIVGIFLILALIGTIGILIMMRSFARPIVLLTKTTHAIAETGDLTKTAAVNRQDEVGQLSKAFDQMIERLQKSEVMLAHAAAEERNRLARDLHDAVSQTLFSASLIADVLPRLWERDQAEGRKRLEEVRQLTRGALAEMRTLLLELRPSSLVEAEIGYLLRQLGESITGRSRVPVKVTIDGECSVPTEVKIALYRVAQEALNNVAKHAGAKEAEVGLVCSPDQVVLKITDDGQGFDIKANSTKSLGLGIIRERAKEIGASLEIKSTIGSGTEISLIWKNKAL